MKFRCNDCDYTNLKDKQEIEVVMHGEYSERGKITYTRHNGKYCPYMESDKRYEPICQMACITKIM